METKHAFSFVERWKTFRLRKAKKMYTWLRIGQCKTKLNCYVYVFSSWDTTSPTIIYPNKRLPKNILSALPESWGNDLTDNGCWMQCEAFGEYIKNVLYPSFKNKVEFPKIIFVDGHKTYLSLELSNLCTVLQIVLIALHFNSTRILQPSDVLSFKPLKCLRKKSVLDWRWNNPYCNLAKEYFAPI